MVHMFSCSHNLALLVLIKFSTRKLAGSADHHCGALFIIYGYSSCNYGLECALACNEWMKHLGCLDQCSFIPYWRFHNSWVLGGGRASDEVYLVIGVLENHIWMWPDCAGANKVLLGIFTM
jgi:hypothetical protein